MLFDSNLDPSIAGAGRVVAIRELCLAVTYRVQAIGCDGGVSRQKFDDGSGSPL